MKVKDLIATLETCDMEADVVIAVDEEGNGFNMATGVEDHLRAVSGNFGQVNLYASGDDAPKTAVEAVCIWP